MNLYLFTLITLSICSAALGMETTTILKIAASLNNCEEIYNNQGLSFTVVINECTTIPISPNSFKTVIVDTNQIQMCVWTSGDCSGTGQCERYTTDVCENLVAMSIFARFTLEKTVMTTSAPVTIAPTTTTTANPNATTTLAPLPPVVSNITQTFGPSCNASMQITTDDIINGTCRLFEYPLSTSSQRLWILNTTTLYGCFYVANTNCTNNATSCGYFRNGVCSLILTRYESGLGVDIFATFTWNIQFPTRPPVRTTRPPTPTTGNYTTTSDAAVEFAPQQLLMLMVLFAPIALLM